MKKMKEPSPFMKPLGIDATASCVNRTFAALGGENQSERRYCAEWD
jgi:hypothetical protein